MVQKIKGTQLEKVVGDILDEFSGEVLTVTRKAVDRTADEVTQRTVSGVVSKGLVRTGRYRGNWSHKEDDDVRGGRFSYSRVVYNEAPTYRLTHLLEHGHGGPHPAPAYPHIVPDDETERILEKNFMEALG